MKRRPLTLAACCVVHAVQDGLHAALYVVLPILAQTFGLGYAEVGMVRAINNSAMAVFELPSGMLAERLGERTLMVFGLGCAGCGYLALWTAATLPFIAACLFLVGLGAGFQHALSSSIISKTFEASSARAALGTYNSSGDIGKLVYTGLFSLAIGVGLGWQSVVAGFGVTTLLTAVALWLVLSRLAVGARPAARTGPATGGPAGWGIRDRGGFAALVSIVFLDITVQGSFLTFLAFVMIEKEVPASLAAFAVVLTLAGGACGKFGCGFLAQRLGVVRSLAIVQCLTAAGIVALILAPALAAFSLLPFLGMVLQGSSSITYGSVGDLVRPDRRSRGFAAIYSTSSIASVAGPVTFGLISARFGLTSALLSMASVVLLTLPLAAWLRPALARSYAA